MRVTGGFQQWINLPNLYLGQEITLYKCKHAVGDLWEVVMFQWLHTWRSNVQRFPDSQKLVVAWFSTTDKESTCSWTLHINSLSINKTHIIKLLRCGCLPLEVETGRRRVPKTPQIQKICGFCHNGIGNETHFLNASPFNIVWTTLQGFVAILMKSQLIVDHLQLKMWPNKTPHFTQYD